MKNRPQRIARLRCLSFLIEEALRLSDEGELTVVAAKLSSANDRVVYELELLANKPQAKLPALADVERSCG